MGKFKEGQYVVATRNALHIKNGDVVQVERYARPTTIRDWLMIKDKRNDTDDGSYPEQDFTAWVPKVGERVRIVNPHYDFKQGHKGREFTITEQQGSHDGEAAWVGYPESRPYIWTASELEPVDLPVAAEVQAATPAAALKVEAGRYYKTRRVWKRALTAAACAAVIGLTYALIPVAFAVGGAAIGVWFVGAEVYGWLDSKTTD